MSGILNLGWILAKVFENGKPLSRTKAHVNRETDAKALNSATATIKKIAIMRMFVAATDFVVREYTSIIGRLPEFVTVSRLPMVKRRQMTKANCMIALETVEVMILNGTRVRTFFTSAPSSPN